MSYWMLFSNAIKINEIMKSIPVEFSEAGKFASSPGNCEL